MNQILTVTEAIAALQRSSLPTIVTEGRDDYLVFRRIEEEFIEVGLDIISVGGRDSVLSIFERRKELGRNDILFFVDKDFWVFTGLPQNLVHRKLLTTFGYSIENDLYIDGSPEDILTNAEKIAFSNELKDIIRWYCFAITRRLAGDSESLIRTHPNVVLSNGSLCPDYCKKIDYHEPDEDAISKMLADYKSDLRGKNLINLIVRHLSHQARWPKYSKHQIIDMAASKKGPLFMRIQNCIEELLSEIYGRPVTK